MIRFSVCIPMYNESGVIAGTAAELNRYLTEEFGDEYELIFCDDGSSDGSADIVRNLGLPRVRVIGYPENRGKGYAVRYALSESRGEYALFTDADLAYGTKVIRQFYDEFLNNPDASLVLGSRNLSGEGYKAYPFIRRVASKTYLKVLSIAGGLRLSDSQCGCKAFRRDAIEQIMPRCTVDRFAFDFEIILWAEKLGLKIKETPVSVLNFGESKVHVIRDTFRMLRDLRKMKKRIKKADV